MKRLIFTAAASILCATAAMAAPGDMGVGINLGAAPCIEKDANLTNFIVGVKYQYQVTNLIRLQADVDFGFKDKGVSTFNAMANAHFLIPCAKNFTLYPLAGIGYGSVKHSFKIDDHNVTDNADKFAFNIGIGAEYAITSNWAANFEFKYQYMPDFSRLPILVGLTYKF
ncbi:MAG: porin family protein [Bacteroides sp.]|nr:porin family protein [Bacteroides sp.]